jgi:hypothetical protein
MVGICCCFGKPVVDKNMGGLLWRFVWPQGASMKICEQLLLLTSTVLVQDLEQIALQKQCVQAGHLLTCV